MVSDRQDPVGRVEGEIFPFYNVVSPRALSRTIDLDFVVVIPGPRYTYR
jgi:hypothetical protein